MSGGTFEQQPAVSGAPARHTGVVHGTFSLDASFSVPRHRVFAAFSDMALRQQWFRLPGATVDTPHELEFCVGGHELARSTFLETGTREELEYHARFYDIIVDERIVLTYEVHLNGRLQWISLLTIEMAGSDNDTTRLRWTEQYAFVNPSGDGERDVAHLLGGTRLQLTGLKLAVEAGPDGASARRAPPSLEH
jgi:uncharacterized protein YndB with AHSA1/START domain